MIEENRDLGVSSLKPVSFLRLPSASVFESVAAELIVLHSLDQLLSSVHHEGTLLGHGLSDRLA